MTEAHSFFFLLLEPHWLPGALQGCVTGLRDNPTQVLSSKSFLEMYPADLLMVPTLCCTAAGVLQDRLIPYHSAGCNRHLGFLTNVPQSLQGTDWCRVPLLQRMGSGHQAPKAGLLVLRASQLRQVSVSLLPSGLRASRHRSVLLLRSQSS